MMQGSRQDGSRREHDRGVNGAASNHRGGRFEDSPILTLLRKVLASLGATARDKSALLKSELRNTAKSYAMAAAACVVSVIAAGAIMNFLGVAAIAGLLALEIPLWGAALICVAVLAGILVAAVVFGLGAIRNADLLPRRTIRNVRRDFKAMRDAFEREGE